MKIDDIPETGTFILSWSVRDFLSREEVRNDVVTITKTRKNSRVHLSSGQQYDSVKEFKVALGLMRATILSVLLDNGTIIQ